MGPVILVIQVVGMIAAAVAAGQAIAIQVIQKQMKDMINEHQQQFDALKDLQVYLQSLIKQQDIKIEEELQKQDLFQNIAEVQAFLQITKNNLQKLIRNYPQSLSGYLIPPKDAKQVIATAKQGDNLQTTRYFMTKQRMDKQIPSYAATSVKVAFTTKGVDWGYVGNLLLIPGLLAFNWGLTTLWMRSFLIAGQITAGAILNSILSGIGLVFSIYSIVQSAIELEKLIKQKEKITKDLAALPKTQVDALNGLKGSITSFLLYVIIGGDLIGRVRQRFEFVVHFSSNQVVNKQLNYALSIIKVPYQINSLAQISKIQKFASELQDIYKQQINQANAKQKLFEVDQFFKRFFLAVKIDAIHIQMNNVFNSIKKYLPIANTEFNSMRGTSEYLDDVIKYLKRTPQSKDKKMAKFLEYNYLVIFNKEKMTNEDKIIIVKSIACIRNKFYGDDPSGLTYYGYRLIDYQYKGIKYSDIAKAEPGSENITQYEGDWMKQYRGQIIQQLNKTFPSQLFFLYYKTTLNFHTVGPLQSLQLQTKKIIYFKGKDYKYKVECGLENHPKFDIKADHSQPDGQIIHFLTPYNQILPRGKTMFPGQFLRSTNGYYYAILQRDGNFVVYQGYNFNDKHDIMWQTNTKGSISQGYRLTMQMDGNLCLYNSKDQAIWTSNTWKSNNPNHKLILQQNGALVIVNDQGYRVWESN